MARKNSAAPGTQSPQAATAKRKQVVKKKDAFVAPDGAAYVVAEGEGESRTVRFTEWPADFDPKTHKPLTRSQFADESVYYTHQADAFEARAKRFRGLATQSKQLGGLKDKTKAKKLLKMQARLNELRASIEADGTDVAALLQLLAAQQAAAAIKTAPTVASNGQAHVEELETASA